MGNGRQRLVQGFALQIHMGNRVDYFLAELRDDRREQAVLTVEVGVDRALGATNPGDDAVHADSGVAISEEHFGRGLENVLTFFGLPGGVHTFPIFLKCTVPVSSVQNTGIA
ncbi:hypothetical protein D9M71_344340 [compost metagenome]